MDAHVNQSKDWPNGHTSVSHFSTAFPHSERTRSTPHFCWHASGCTSFGAAMSPNTKTRSKSTPPSARNSPACSIYERSKLRLAAREENLRKTEREMMGACTFTPETNKSSGNGSPGSSTVFDRLYSDAKNKLTPKKSNASHLAPHKKSPTSVSSSNSSPSRFVALYQDAVRRQKNRAYSDKKEEAARMRRLDEEELKKCTFKPNLDWRGKIRTSPVQASPASNEGRQTWSAPKRKQHGQSRSRSSPPVDIVTTRTSGSFEKANRHIKSTELVSPLRVPTAVQDEKKDDGLDSVGAATDYGSI